MRRNYFPIILFFLYALGFAGILASREVFRVHEEAIGARVQSRLLSARLYDVLSLRSSEAVDESEARLLFVGDIMLSRDIASQIKKHNDVRYPFLQIASTTRAADLTFGNLEGPISTRGKNQGSIYSFRADPNIIAGLIFAGFDVLSLANNHMMDWGRDALYDTVVYLQRVGIDPIGAGVNIDVANHPSMREINNTRIALFAYTTLYPKSFEATTSTPGVSHFDLESAKKAIQEIQNRADIVIVSFHWGEEYQVNANAEQKKIARALIDAGADLVIGHHPHVVQEIEQYAHGWIAYSLGNFVFDQNFSKETKQGLMLMVTLHNRKIREVRETKVMFTKSYQPFLPEPEMVQ